MALTYMKFANNREFLKTAKSTFLESKIPEIYFMKFKKERLFLYSFFSFKLHKNHKTVCFAKEIYIKLYLMGFGGGALESF